MTFPKISVVITTYNRPKAVVKAIKSVHTQTYIYYELHVVDDGSEIESQNVVKGLLAGQKNAYYWRNSNRRGLASARNLGIKKSSGEYIAFLDDDDEWKPEAIEKRVALLADIPKKEREKLGIIYCGCESHILHEKRITYNMPRIEGNIKEFIINNDLNTIPSSCLFPKKVLVSIGGFDESLTSSIDHDIWMNIAVHGYHAFAVKEPLVITYNTKNRRRMVTDAAPRLQGVEGFLEKWRPIYQKWFGREGGAHYIRRYRTRVLGLLAGIKLCERNYLEAWRIIKHIHCRNSIYNRDGFVLADLITRCIVREFIPVKLINLMKRSINYNERMIGQ